MADIKAFRIDDDKFERFSKICEAKGLNFSEAMNELVSLAIVSPEIILSPREIDDIKGELASDRLLEKKIDEVEALKENMEIAIGDFEELKENMEIAIGDFEELNGEDRLQSLETFQEDIEYDVSELKERIKELNEAMDRLEAARKSDILSFNTCLEMRDKEIETIKTLIREKLK